MALQTVVRREVVSNQTSLNGDVEEEEEEAPEEISPHVIITSAKQERSMVCFMHRLGILNRCKCKFGSRLLR
ncbi:hypothetical protein CRUP_034929 [Coryphaenoides rupestris]|nr:hypothetical protein CRUP_034929 [Coryphaenoides rupestris]